MTDRYAVIVGNIGFVYSGNNKREAVKIYNVYLEKSLTSDGSRCYGESISLMVDGEPEREHYGHLCEVI